MDTKVCRKCNIEKPVTKFSKHGSTKDRLQPWCNDCKNARRQEARARKEGYYATEREREHDTHIIRCRQTYSRAKQRVFEHYCPDGPRCVLCGFDDPRALSIDHVNGGGNAHRKVLKGVNLYRWIERNGYPKDFQVLCMNCQFIKRYEQCGFSVV
jgi:hypothetical protein